MISQVTWTRLRRKCCTPSSNPWCAGLDDVMTVPAWKVLPSWYLVAQDDRGAPRLTPSGCSPTA